MTTPPPSQIGRYRIVRELGRGTMGVVYEALDTALDRTVALKTFGTMTTIAPHEREAFERRFLSEAKISATLENENVVGVYDVGRDFETGLLFMALEYVRGESLAETLLRGPLPWEDAATIVVKVARALHDAHKHHIVHRDIKPANIMLTVAGEPKVMDFGIAKASAAQLTLAGQVFGTPAYMSPEQASGDAVDGRSDVFSLGCVLYELVTDIRPFEGPSMAATLAKIMSDEPAPASSVATVPRALDAIIGRALRKQREARYDSAAHLAADLDRLLRGQPAVHATQLVPLDPLDPAESPKSARAAKHRPAPVAPAASKHKLPKSVIGAVALVLALLGLGSGLLLPRRPEAPIPEVAGTPVTAETPDVPETPRAAAATPVESASENANVPSPKPPFNPAPVSTPAAVVLSVEGFGAPAKVTLQLKYPFGSASLRVKMDDSVVFATSIRGMPIRSEGVTTGYDGRFSTDLSIPPGDHLLQIEVRSGEETFIESTRVHLRSGDNRRLMALLDGVLTLTIE